MIQCGKKKRPEAQFTEQYYADAKIFCDAIVECMKKDIGDRLKDHPERKEMVMNRMTRDLCLKGQTHLIGELSVEVTPVKNNLSDKKNLYEEYHKCAKAVYEAPSCDDKKSAHKSHPSCIKIRSLYPDD